MVQFRRSAAGITAIIAVLIALASCANASDPAADIPGDSGGGPTNPGGSGDPATPGGSPVDGYALTLSEGDYWTFWWDWSDKVTWVSAYDSGSDNETGSGYVTITLGAESTIGGKPARSVTLTGDIPPRWASNPYWKWIGSDSSGIYGSQDGYTLAQIFDSSTGRVKNGFFKRWVNLTDAQSPVVTAGSYTAAGPTAWSTSVHAAAWGSAYDDTIIVPGFDPIAGDEYTRNASEYFKAGVGPIACADYEYLYDRESSSDSTTYITNWKFCLVGTSLAAADGFVVPKPAWESRPMPDAREDPAAVSLLGSTYVLLGGSLYQGNRTMWRQNADGSWQRMADLPTEFSGLYGYGTACVFGTKLYAFVEAKPAYKTAIYCYSPLGNSWSLASTPGTDYAPSASAVNGDEILVAGKSGAICSYDPATNAEKYLGSLSAKFSYVAMARDQFGIYLVGQYNAYGDVYTTGFWTLTAAEGWAQKTWIADGLRRWKPALAVHGGRLWVFGGNGKTVFSAALNTGVASGWTAHEDMLYGGPMISALADGDEIRVYGTNGGKTIEVYAPDAD